MFYRIVSSLICLLAGMFLTYKMLQNFGEINVQYALMIVVLCIVHEKWQELIDEKTWASRLFLWADIDEFVHLILFVLAIIALFYGLWLLFIVFIISCTYINHMKVKREEALYG